MADSIFTKGKVQIMCDGRGSDVKIAIAATQDYSVKHGERTYTVFMPESELSKGTKKDKAVDGALVFKAEQEFTAKGERLVDAITTAAHNGTVIEIEIKTAAPLAVVSVKIPAKL
jgi:hypothetical protein